MVEFTSGPVRGFVADGFEPVAEEFSRNFTERSDVGAAFAVVRHGEVIVDLHGGSAAPGRPWNENTLQVIFSGTKGLVATCMLMLVDRGLLDLDRPVAHYWPKFAAADKGGLLVRDIVCHRSGLPGITGAALAADDVADDEAMESRLAAQPLSSDPNAYRCYHALTIGWLCGGVLRHIDGRSIGRFFADEIAGPLGLDIWIGLPEAQEARVGRLELAADWLPWDAGLTPQQVADPTRRSIWANPPLFPHELPWNARRSHAGEIPGGGAIASARSMARLYAAWPMAASWTACASCVPRRLPRAGASSTGSPTRSSWSRCRSARSSGCRPSRRPTDRLPTRSDIRAPVGPSMGHGRARGSGCPTS
jgi:CubicO group peptidase (beta-lactamase class C family)